MKTVCLSLVLTWFLSLSGCIKIEYSAFNASPDTGKSRNLRFALPSFDVAGGKVVRFALISDSHQNYSDLEETIEIINRLGVDFTLHLGDFTDFGLAEEYEIFYHFLGQLRSPAWVLPGNHDLKTFRSKLYKRVFGPSDKALVTNFGKLILWNDCILAMRPETVNFDFLTQEIASADPTQPLFIFHHHDPMNAQNYLSSEKALYANAVASHPQVFIFHGHLHAYDHKPLGATAEVFQLNRTREMNWAFVEVSSTTIRVFYCQKRHCTKVYENNLI